MDITIKLETLPTEGMRFLQIQNPDGMSSNDFIFFVTQDDLNDAFSASSRQPANGAAFLK